MVTLSAFKERVFHFVRHCSHLKEGGGEKDAAIANVIQMRSGMR
jgi:hypothetical protein